MKEYLGKKTFTVEHYPTCGSIEIEIDFDFKHKWNEVETSQIDAIHTMNNFFTGSEDRLNEADGDVVVAFLKMITKKILMMSIEFYCNAYGIVLQFDKGEEGYIKLDGSQGMKLIDLDIPDFDCENDYGITVN